MKTIVQTLMVLLLTAALGGCAASTGSKLIGQPSPDVRLTMFDGTMVTLQSFRGKPTVLAFWASTCTFSPTALEGFDKKVASKMDPSRVNFIAVSLDKTEDLADVRKMIVQRDMDHFKHALSGNAEYDEAYLAFGGRELPYYVYLDANQTIRYAGTDRSEVEKLLGN